MSSKFGQIRSRTVELAALEHLKIDVALFLVSQLWLYLGNGQVNVYRTIGPLVYLMLCGVGVSCRILYLIVLLAIYMQAPADQLPRLGRRELICLLSFTCKNAVSFWRGFLFLYVLGMGCVILLWHSLSFQYN